MTLKEKTIAKKLLGLCLQKIIEDNKKDTSETSIKSLRQLAAASGVEYSIIQRISAGKKDPQFTTLVTLAEALEISISDLLSQYGKIQPKLSEKSKKK